MKLKKPLCAFFLAFFLGSSIKHPQDNKVYAKVTVAPLTDGMDTKSSGIAEKNSESFVGGSAKSQAGSKSGSSIYVTKGSGTNSGVSSPILGSVASLGRFADFGPDPEPSTWKASGKKTVLNLIPNEKINLSNALSWVDSHQGAKHLNHQLNHQSHDIGNAVEENLDSANLPANKAEEDGLNEILNHPNLQFDSPKETLEEDIFPKPPTNRRSRNSSISRVWSDASLDWDGSEQGATLSDCDYESPPVIRKSSTPDQAFTWDDAEQPLSFFNVCEGSDEEELDLDTEPLFKDAISREIAREPMENLSAEEKFPLQRALRLAQGAVPAEYMTLCYIDEKDFQRTTARRHSITQPDFPQKIVSRQFILRDPDFL